WAVRPPHGDARPDPRAGPGRGPRPAPGGLAAMTTVVGADAARVRAAARLRGTIALPGDKSISHRALLLAGIAAGESRIEGASDGADVRSTAGVLRALGVTVEQVGDEGGRVGYRVASDGIDGLRQPAADLDCGNSGTTLRLTAGLLAGV